ncbi:MAG: lipocalin family protein [Acidobacteriota bacterium]|nr:MAG: lipocalin family protein [Acidobacteriota bacterium]
MKKILGLILAGALLATGLFAQGEGTLNTVASVDLDRYKGKWFEIARYPNKFQKKCVGNTTATYTIESDGDIEVLNECLKKNGKTDRAKGEARIVDESTNAKLEVRFAPAFLSFLPFVWGDYWVIDLADDYSYAVVGDPKREYLWILSRTPELETSVYQGILRRVEEKGFDPGKLVETPQNVEVLKGQVIGE